MELTTLPAFPRLRLLTYNVFMRPPGINTHGDDFKDDRLIFIKQHIKDYDIICFQQLFSTGNFRRERLIEFAINNDFYFFEYCEAPSFFSGSPVDAGLVVISRYPIVASRFESYNLGILSDSASDKGYLYCKLAVSNHIIHLFNTHLQASYNEHGDDDPIRKLTIMTRLHQMEVLSNRIDSIVSEEKVNPEGDLIIIAGDLNADAKKVYKQMDFNDSKGFVEKYGLEVGEFSEYDLMKRILEKKGANRVIDHLFDNHSDHPATYGHEEVVFTSPDDINSGQRLDYILQIIRQEELTKLHPITQSCVVQKFVVKDHKFTHLSDHYGVSIDFGVRPV